MMVCNSVHTLATTDDLLDLPKDAWGEGEGERDLPVPGTPKAEGADDLCPTVFGWLLAEARCVDGRHRETLA